MNISTITALAKLKGELNIPYLAELLPINDYIISIGYGKSKRGAISSRKDSFPNCIQVRIADYANGSTTTVKISNSTIHFTGITDIAKAETITNNILSIIADLELIGRWIDNNKLEISDRRVILQLDNDTVTSFEQFELPSNKLVAKYLQYYQNEFIINDIIEHKLSLINEQPLYNGPLEIRDIKTSMIRYNINIGHLICPFRLTVALRRYSDIIVIFNPNTHDTVKILLPSEVPEQFRKTSSRRDFDKVYHTFHVKSNGNCYYSGVDLQLDRYAWDYISQVFREIENDIKPVTDNELVSLICSN